MRLWHQSLIPYLPRQQLLGQHRECCALRGRGWRRPHTTVNYVWENYTPSRLVAYHYLIMNEMKARGYHPDPIWYNVNWRGNTLGEVNGWVAQKIVDVLVDKNEILYKEHNDKYLEECLENLKSKGIDLYGINGTGWPCSK